MELKLNRSGLKKGIHYAVLLGITVLYIFPLVWMVVSSFKPESALIKDLYMGIRAFLPTELTLNNYLRAFERVRFARYLFNSIFVTCTTVFLLLLVNSMAGYAFARLKFPGKGVLFNIVIAMIIIPPQAIVLPQFLIVNDLGWVNSYSGLIIPFMANGLAIYIFRQFFLNLPEAVEDAARIDGCGLLRMFFSIVVPMSKPVFASVAVLNITSIWNQFLWPLIILNDENMYTIQLGIQQFFSQTPIYFGQIMAALVVSSLPVIILFLLLQNYFIGGMSGMGK